MYMKVLVGLLADVFGRRSKTAASNPRRGKLYRFRELETQRIDLTDYIGDSMRVPAVQKYFRDNPRVKYVYMVTAIKVARGTGLSLKRGQDLDGCTNADPNNPSRGIAVRWRSLRSRWTNNQEPLQDTFDNSSDFVFAYSLRQITIQRKTRRIFKDYIKGAAYKGKKHQRRTYLEDSAVDNEARGHGSLKYRVSDYDFGAEAVPAGYRAVHIEEGTGGIGQLLL